MFIPPMLALENNESCGCGSNEYKSSVTNLPFHFSVMEFVPSLDPAEASDKPSIGNPPPSFSWLDYGGKDWTTPARYQGMCGSCWDFAAVGALESIINIREGMAELDADLSEQYILSCLPKSGSCKGGSPYLAFHYIKYTGSDGNNCNGIITEDCMPYQANDAIPCDAKCNDWEEKLVPIADYGYWIPDGSDEDRQRIKTQIMEDGPVVTFMMATEDFMEWGLNHHSPNEYYPYSYAEGINHCVVIVGWKDDSSIPHGGYWICKNSWGSYWGYNGFFNIEYGSLHIDDYSIVWVEYDKDAYDWPPVADAGGPYVGSVGEQISFDGSNSIDDSGDIAAWHWDFGDGATSNEQNPEHAYDERGIYNVELTVTDENGKENIDKTAAFIDTWRRGDKWTFDVNIEAEMDYMGHVVFNGNLDALTFEVINDASNYKLDFNGKLKGEFSFASQPPLNLTGKFLFSRMKGSIYITKDFSIEEFDAKISGLAIIRLQNFFIPIPVPFKVDIKTDFSNSYAVIEFPLEEGKTWNMPIVDINIDAVASAFFGIMNIPIEQSISLGAIEANCLGKENVATKAGTFEAYKISIYDILQFYYSYEIANIVKATVEYEGINIEAELVEVDYE